MVKIENYITSDCATHVQIFFEHGTCSIRDYVLVEILAETVQESLEDYLQSTGQNNFTCHGNKLAAEDFIIAGSVLVTLRDTYGIVSLQIDLFVVSHRVSIDPIVLLACFLRKFIIRWYDRKRIETFIDVSRLTSAGHRRSCE